MERRKGLLSTLFDLDLTKNPPIRWTERLGGLIENFGNRVIESEKREWEEFPLVEGLEIGFSLS